MASAELLALDAAMMRLRRVWAIPPARSPQVPDRTGRVELSTVLVVEACMNHEADGLTTVAEVGTFAGVAPSTASRFVSRAVDAGVVEREQHEDGRRAAVRVTEPGRELFERARAFRHERLGSTLDGWTDAEIVVFVHLMGRFAAAAVDPDRGAPLVPSHNGNEHADSD